MFQRMLRKEITMYLFHEEIQHWKDWERIVSDDIDFYIVENDEKYYFCFEDLSLGVLENYTNKYGMEFFEYYE